MLNALQAIATTPAAVVVPAMEATRAAATVTGTLLLATPQEDMEEGLILSEFSLVYSL